MGIVLSGNASSDEGLVKMLLEKQMDFDIVLPEENLSRFDAIILPDSVILDEGFMVKLNTFILDGGGVLITGESGLNKGKTRFILDIGANYQGQSVFECDYVRAGKELNGGIVNTPFLFYQAAHQVCVTDGEILAWTREPYFNRTYGHYCSHQNTPYKLEDAPYPAAVRKRNVIYLAHNLCSMYFHHGAQYHRDYFINALKLIYKEEELGLPDKLPATGIYYTYCMGCPYIEVGHPLLKICHQFIIFQPLLK